MSVRPPSQLDGDAFSRRAAEGSFCSLFSARSFGSERQQSTQQKEKRGKHSQQQPASQPEEEKKRGTP